MNTGFCGPSTCITFLKALQDLGAHHLPLAASHLRGPSLALRRVDASTTPGGKKNIGSPNCFFLRWHPIVANPTSVEGFQRKILFVKVVNNKYMTKSCGQQVDPCFKEVLVIHVQAKFSILEGAFASQDIKR